jgi:hypothetical protein
MIGIINSDGVNSGFTGTGVSQSVLFKTNGGAPFYFGPQQACSCTESPDFYYYISYFGGNIKAFMGAHDYLVFQSILSCLHAMGEKYEQLALQIERLAAGSVVPVKRHF